MRLAGCFSLQTCPPVTAVGSLAPPDRGGPWPHQLVRSVKQLMVNLAQSVDVVDLSPKSGSMVDVALDLGH